MTGEASATDFAGGVAVITGAGSGLGAGLVGRALARGMRIVLADIDGDVVQHRSDEINRGAGKSIAARIDVSDASSVDALAQLAYDTWGRVDLLVNNAGVEAHGLLWEMSPAQWARVIDVNLNGVFHGLRSFLPHMLEQGGRAHIVNVASVAALGTRPYTAPYGASKHGCLALSEIAAAEVQSVNPDVFVSVAIPGAVRTNIFVNAQTADDDGVGARDKRTRHELVTSTGMDPAAAAEIILDGASRGLLRIHTHPELSAERIAERARSLADFDQLSANKSAVGSAPLTTPYPGESHA